jgi:pimeloyl-ACP methyl ester carboxylesterase
LIVPGYGMNSFIFGYSPGLVPHDGPRREGPRGRSFEAALVDGGLEVWRVDLRAQGGSRPIRAVSASYGLDDLAVTDLGAAISAALDRTQTSADNVAVIGASLGGTIMFAHAALEPRHHIGAMVSIGGPIRWIRIHPILRVAFASPWLVGSIPLRGTRALAKTVLPYVIRHTPWLLSMYINREHVDLDNIEELVKTVEDPNRYVNRQIAKWVADKDLLVRGTNLTHALRSIVTPLLCVVANADGIVPRETAEYCYRHAGSTDKTLLEVGSSDMRLAHADMFISHHAEGIVFAPIRDWILAR